MSYANIGSPVTIYIHSDGLRSRNLSCITYEGTRNVTYIDGEALYSAEYDISAVKGSFNPSESFSDAMLDKLTYYIRSYLHITDPCRYRKSVDLMASDSNGRIQFSLI